MKQVRFLILRGGAIGDFVLTLPAIQALRDRWPGAHIELLGYPHIANLALAGRLVDHVDSLDRAEVARFFAAVPSFTEEQVDHIASFDLIFLYLHDPQGVVRGNLLAAGARQVIYGSPLVQSGHAVDHLMKPLEALAIYGDHPNSSLSLSESLCARGRDWLKERGLDPGLVAVHPGSGSSRKNWPAERFAELVTRLRSKGTAVLLVFGEADHAVSAVLRTRLPEVPVLADRSLVDVASVLSACGGYVGNDSGITHVAAALGLPVVALFGPSDSGIWGPRGPNVRILRAPEGDLARLDVDRVWEMMRTIQHSPAG
jgi:heptosyltransferase III